MSPQHIYPTCYNVEKKWQPQILPFVPSTLTAPDMKNWSYHWRPRLNMVGISAPTLFLVPGSPMVSSYAVDANASANQRSDEAPRHQIAAWPWLVLGSEKFGSGELGQIIRSDQAAPHLGCSRNEIRYRFSCPAAFSSLILGTSCWLSSFSSPRPWLLLWSRQAMRLLILARPRRACLPTARVV